MSRFVSYCCSLSLAGCAQQSSRIDASTARPTTAVAFNVAGAPTVEFNVPDMMCPEGCGAKMKEILSEQPGAKEVVINFDAKTATVADRRRQVRRRSGDRGARGSWLRAFDAEVGRCADADAATAPAEQPAG